MMNNANELKIAIIHDSFTYLGGAERVLLNFVKIFPNADVYTSIVSSSNLALLKKKSKGKIFYSKISKVKWVVSHPDFFKPYILLYWQSLNLNKYDLVISSSHSYCSNWVNVQGLHVSYIHTPPRYLYGEFSETVFLKKFPFRQLLKFVFDWIRKTDYKKLQKVDVLVSNSKYIRKKILKYYNRSSTVIYPPISLIKKKVGKTIEKNYYLFFSRLVKQKGGDLAIKAFNKNGRTLLMVGQGKEYKRLKKAAKNNIRFLPFQSDDKLYRLFQGAKCLIYCSIQEDFGMVPVEAMAHGVPVIAYKSGGVEESIIEGKTGLFFRKYDERSLNKVITEFEKMTFRQNDCIKQAERFNENIFKTRILKITSQAGSVYQ